MTDNEIQALFEATLHKAKVQLTPKQNDTFLLACKRVFLDNPDNNFDEHLIAARIYLNSILSFPDLTLPKDDRRITM